MSGKIMEGLRAFAPENYLSPDDAQAMKELDAIGRAACIRPDAGDYNSEAARVNAVLFGWAYGDDADTVLNTLTVRQIEEQGGDLYYNLTIRLTEYRDKAISVFSDKYKEHPKDVLTVLREKACAYVEMWRRTVVPMLAKDGYTEEEMRALKIVSPVIARDFDSHDEPTVPALQDGERYPRTSAEFEYAQSFTDDILEANIRDTYRHLVKSLEKAGGTWIKRGTDTIRKIIVEKWTVRSAKEADPEPPALARTTARKQRSLPAIPRVLPNRFEPTAQVFKLALGPGAKHVQMTRGETIQIRTGKKIYTRTGLITDDIGTDVQEAGGGWPDTLTRGLESLWAFDRTMLSGMYGRLNYLDDHGIQFHPDDAIIPVAQLWLGAMPNPFTKERTREVSAIQAGHVRASALLLGHTRILLDCELYRLRTGLPMRGEARYTTLADLDYITERIHGQKCDCVQIKAVPYPYTYLRALGQFETIPVEYLGRPCLSATVDNIALYETILDCIITIKRTSGATSRRISYDYIFAATHTNYTDRQKKKRMLAAARKLLDAWQGVSKGGTGLFSAWAEDAAGCDGLPAGFIINLTARERENAGAPLESK